MQITAIHAENLFSLKHTNKLLLILLVGLYGFFSASLQKSYSPVNTTGFPFMGCSKEALSDLYSWLSTFLLFHVRFQEGDEHTH